LNKDKTKKIDKVDLNIIELTDLGIAKTMACLFGEDLGYCHQLKQWLIWNGGKWEWDHTEKIRIFADKTIAELIKQAASNTDSSKRTQRIKQLLSFQNNPRITGMIHEAQPLLPIDAKKLDTDNWLLNTPQGTIDLKTGKFRKHIRTDYITKSILVAYDAKAQYPIWESFLIDIMMGNIEMIRYLQKAVGYCLTGDTSEQCIFILYGFGDNGKSTFQTTIMQILGEFAMQTATETLLTKKFDSIPCDLARLRGSRMVAAAENDIGRRFSESLIKQITGGDEITGRQLYKDPIQYKPTYKIFLSTNHRPVVIESTHAIWRRMRLIPFNFIVPSERKDKHLPDKLALESSGILNWAIEGCLLWQKEGLDPPLEVKNATATYREDMDLLAGFLHDRCELDVSFKSPASDLYLNYKSWCGSNSEESMSQKSFGSILAEKGFTKQRENTMAKRTIYNGIRLKESVD
jgi:putative DNA primase/helicase